MPQSHQSHRNPISQKPKSEKPFPVVLDGTRKAIFSITAGGSEDLHVFRGFNGCLVAKNQGRTSSGPEWISHDQMLRFKSLWFSGALGTSVAMFRKQFATLSGRSRSASAAANAGVRAELWGEHGDWHSFAAQKVYTRSDAEPLLSVSKAAKSLSEVPKVAGQTENEPAGVPPGSGIQVEEDVRTAVESAGDPQLGAEEDLPPEVVVVPRGAFQWSV